MDICDFCNSPHVVKRFECLDFDSDSKDAGVFYLKSTGPSHLVFKSINYWAACKGCALLVDAEELDGLVERVVEEFEKQNEPVDEGLRMHLEQTYRLFFKNRIRVSS